MKSKFVLIRVILILFAMIVALLYIGPLVTTGELNIGVLTGLGFAVVITLYAMLFEPVNKAVKSFNQKKAGKIATSVICTVLALGIGVGGFAFANVAKHSTANEKQTDYVIVLGCMVRGDRPGIFLSKRINKAYEYLNKYPEAYAVLSGGQGNGEDISEARCMYNALTQMGIEPSRLLLEEKSTSTKENFENSVAMLNDMGVGINEITVVTNDFHEYRAYEFAKRCGIKAYSYPSKTPWNGYMPFATREVFAVVYQIFLN